MKAPVNRVIPFSSVDGPGNRTALFLQGCNINCKYCHNPETRSLCSGCGLCVEKCPGGALKRAGDGKILFTPELCLRCDTCTKVCPHDACPRVLEMTPQEAFDCVRRQIPFIRGLTVSGGECMLYPDFLKELFTLAKAAGLTTLIDSNGTIPFAQYPDLLEVTDGVMLDIKAFDPEDHFHVTGAGNQTVLENAVFLAEHRKLFEVRCVIVPDLYDAEKNVRRTAAFLAPYLSKGDFRIKLIAYRPMGVREAYAHYRIPNADELGSLSEIFRDFGFKNIIII